MKKHIANIVTGVRIFGSVCMLCSSVFSPLFYSTYLLCGFTDMIDGTIARKMEAVSNFGSKLDTIADFVFLAVCTVKLSPIMNIPLWLWIWIAVIGIIKITNIVMGFIRRKELVDYHTFLNKTTGLLLFFLPLTLQFIVPTYSFAVVCTIATIAAIGEGYYSIKVNDK